MLRHYRTHVCTVAALLSLAVAVVVVAVVASRAGCVNCTTFEASMNAHAPMCNRKHVRRTTTTSVGDRGSGLRTFVRQHCIEHCMLTAYSDMM